MNGDLYGNDAHRFNDAYPYGRLRRPILSKGKIVEPCGFAYISTIIKPHQMAGFFIGDLYGNRTRVTSVKGRCPNR